MQVDRYLAQYAPLERWVPAYGDFVINVRFRPWGVFMGDGLYNTRYGVIDSIDGLGNVGVIFDGIPYLLFTMDESMHPANRKQVSIGKIKTSSKGSWAILRHDVKHNTTVWYV